MPSLSQFSLRLRAEDSPGLAKRLKSVDGMYQLFNVDATKVTLSQVQQELLGRNIDG